MQIRIQDIIIIIFFLIFSLHINTSFAQTHNSRRKITGYVLDNNKEPIVGAILISQNSENSSKSKYYTATTDHNGHFELLLPHSHKKLEVRMLSFKPKIIKLNDKTKNLSIILEANNDELDNVVITGFVDRKKNSYTGSTFKINRSDIVEMVHSNAIEIIQLKSPGFELFDDIISGSDPNKIPDMVMRGRSSFIEGDGTNLPLFILDGTEVSLEYIFNMPTEDIENITILKDASATSFYGSKAVNGVIVITTRTTKEGKLQLSFSTNFQLSIPDLSDYNLLNAKEKLEYERLAGIYGDFKGDSETDIQQQISYYTKLDRVNTKIDTDWMRLPLKTSSNQNYNIMLSGGSSLFKYNLSASYNSVTGVMDESSRQDGSLRLNMTYGNLNKLFFQNIISAALNSSQNIPYGNFRDYSRLNPYDTPYNKDGSLNNSLSFNAPNPLFEKSLSSYIDNSSNTLINTTKIFWNIVKGFRLEASASFTLGDNEGCSFYSPDSKRFYFADPLKRGSFSVSNSKRTSSAGNIFLVYNQSLDKDKESLLNITAGFNIESNSNNSNSFTAIGVLSDKLDHPSWAAGFGESSSPGGSRNLSRMLGGYISANSIWKNKYFIDLSFRYEGSSKYGQDNRFAPFGAMGLGWNIHEENFLKSTQLSLLKLRATIGYVGNGGFSAYQSQLMYGYDSDLIYYDTVGAIPLAMHNPFLKWEKSLMRNIGLDFGFFEDRISGSLEGYFNTTNNLIMTISKQPHIGFSNSTENLGKIQNNGIELSLRANILRRSNSNLNIFWNLSHNTNRIVEISEYLKNQNEANEENSSVLPSTYYKEGQSMTALMVMKSAGINPANGREIFINQNGDLTYKYDYNNMSVVGDTTPKFQGSFGFSYYIGAFDISATLGYRLGATVYNQTLANKVEGGNPYENGDKRVFYDRWKSPGDDALYKNIGTRTKTPPTSRFIAKEYALDGSSIKASYSLPYSVAQKLHLRHIRVSASMGDLFNLSTVRRERGLDYPFARVFQLSLNINL